MFWVAMIGLAWATPTTETPVVVDVGVLPVAFEEQVRAAARLPLQNEWLR